MAKTSKLGLSETNLSKELADGLANIEPATGKEGKDPVADPTDPVYNIKPLGAELIGRAIAYGAFDLKK